MPALPTVIDRIVVHDLLVRGRVDVDPQQRRDRPRQQDHRAPRLGAQEVAQRRLEVARPRGPPGQRRGGGLDLLLSSVNRDIGHR